MQKYSHWCFSASSSQPLIFCHACLTYFNFCFSSASSLTLPLRSTPNMSDSTSSIFCHCHSINKAALWQLPDTEVMHVSSILHGGATRGRPGPTAARTLLCRLQLPNSSSCLVGVWISPTVFFRTAYLQDLNCTAGPSSLVQLPGSNAGCSPERRDSFPSEVSRSTPALSAVAKFGNAKITRWV